jgi:ribonucrease Y
MSFFNNLSNLFGTTDASAAPKTAKTSAKPIKLKQPKRIEKKAQPSINSEVATREAQAKAREIIVEAKDEALAIRQATEEKAKNLEKHLENQQNFLQNKLDKLDERLSLMSKKEDYLDGEREKLEGFKEKLEQNKANLLTRLEEISSMTKGEAKKVLLEGLEKKLSKEMAQLIRQKEEEAKEQADDKAKEILIDSMKYAATNYVAEYTVSVVSIPSEEVKGKIIGKNGRNIHTFERRTGVDIDLDTSPTEVKLSCFDPVRREIARIALEKLISDGRIQPVRIEEVVVDVEKQIDRAIFEAGKNLCQEVKVYNIPNGLIKLLGRFKYRFSYGQSMITHTIEETKLGTKLAHELGVDVNTVKLGCLLHDIGKVGDDPDENHVTAGVRIAKQFGMPKEVVDCIAQHHEDESFSGPEQMTVYIADAISGARPGARYDNHEDYIERMKNLEEIASSYKEVKEAFAVQAGRELRVLLNPEISKENDVEVLALKIRDEVQEKVMVPGNVKVTVIREKRGEASTK